MTQKEKAIEIPFGAKDSELIKWEYTIQEGMEAEIKDGKVIIKKAESEDERQRRTLIEWLKDLLVDYREDGDSSSLEMADKTEGWIAYLEKQKDLTTENIYKHSRERMSFWSGQQKEQKPKMTPKWLFRLEFKDSSCGLWYDGTGKWCFESGIGSIGGCKTKTLPMDYDVRYKQDGRDWFSSCSRKEDLMHWYSLEDAKELISKGFVFTRYLATEYHEYDQQTVFIKESALYREEIDIFELFEQQKPISQEDFDAAKHEALWGEQKPAEWEDYKDKVNIPYCSSEPEWSEEDKNKIERLAFLVSVVEEKEMISPSESIDLRNFIKSLRPQQKQEWSEEEQQTVSFAVDWLTKMLERTDVPEAKRDIESVILGLKSLRPPFKDREMKLKILKYLSARCSSLEFEEVEDYLNNLRPSWKPSEEQMTWLNIAKNIVGDTGQTVLKSLYNDLKKL